MNHTGVYLEIGMIWLAVFLPVVGALLLLKLIDWLLD